MYFLMEPVCNSGRKGMHCCEFYAIFDFPSAKITRKEKGRVELYHLPTKKN